ncbi:hypothetical protein MKW94_007120, partial [Papaver nudicaule]|nr:hypothetical protein [Papaver nudicaule]
TRTGVVPPLASRATIAAWKPNGVDDSANGAIADNSTSQDAIPSRSSIRGTPYAPSPTNTFGRSRETTGEVSEIPNMASNVENNPAFRTPYAPSSTNTSSRSRETNEQVSGIPDRASNVEHNSISRTATPPYANNTFRRSIETIQREAEIPIRASNFECNRTSRVAAGFNEINMVDATVAMSEIDIAEEEFAGPSRRTNIECNPTSNAAPYVGEVAIDNSHRLTGDKEIPFTYLASLLSDWAVKKDDAPFIRSKIKCVMTGVRGFQFKKRTKYELLVYVDDGSLISEVCIDHNVVQSRIGYSPEEVNAALSSPDKKVGDKMRETMMAFQTILSNFEGTLLVEMSKNSTVPVALEMNEGSSTSDAWWLLRRLDLITSSQTPQHHQPEPIAISP